MNIQTALSLHPDAVILLEHVLRPLSRDRSWLFAHPEYILSPLQATSYKLLAKKRRAGWPAAYLTGHKEFFGLNFQVTPDVLIPRPETELLVELALSLFPSPLQRGEGRVRSFNIIDVGTGSGNIIISLAKKLSVIARSRSDEAISKFYATDSSLKALAVARSNARRDGVARQIKFLRGNLLSPILNSKFEILDYSLILANLPYLTPRQIKSNPDLAREPRQALIAGRDGLKYYRELFKQVFSLSPRGRGQGEEFHILLEHDPRQKSALQKLARKYFPHSKPVFHRDLASHFRVCEIKINTK